MTWVVLLVVSTTLCAGILVLWLKDTLAALAAASAVSLGLSLLFVILRAPDVALAEAVVGAGLSGVMFALVLRRLPAGEGSR